MILPFTEHNKHIMRISNFDYKTKYFEVTSKFFRISKYEKSTSKLWLRNSKCEKQTSKLRLRKTSRPVMQKLIQYWRKYEIYSTTPCSVKCLKWEKPVLIKRTQKRAEYCNLRDYFLRPEKKSYSIFPNFLLILRKVFLMTFMES